MCLDVKRNAIKRIAFKDIVCYKFLELDRNDNTFETPYQHVTVKLGETYKSDLIKNFIGRHWGEVNRGIHSYKNFEDAKNKAIDFGSDFCVIKCVVPKWSRYYVGSYDSNDSIASSKLRYEEVIFKQE